jgi:hypothetical protein
LKYTILLLKKIILKKKFLKIVKKLLKKLNKKLFIEKIIVDNHIKSFIIEEIKFIGLYNLYLMTLGVIKLAIKKKSNHHK